MLAPDAELAALTAAHSIQLNEKQLEQFETYYRLLIEWNEKMNLTAITERRDVYVKHFYDSLALSFFYPIGQARTVADIGSGAGFPGIPLKIAFPHLRLTIVDALQKRIGFLRTLCETLGIQDVECVHARAEDAARDPRHRDQYDLVTARAVARMNVLAELCLPFVMPGGVFAALKGPDADAEKKEADYAVSALGGRWKEDRAYSLPGIGAARRIIFIEKTGPTPKTYPRKAGIPSKQPLVSKTNG